MAGNFGAGLVALHVLEKNKVQNQMFPSIRKRLVVLVDAIVNLF